MGFMAAAIPVAMSVLGALGKENEKQQAPAVPPPPTLGEIFAMNSRNNQQQQFQQPAMQPLPLISVGGKNG